MTALQPPDCDGSRLPGNMMCRCRHCAAHLLRRNAPDSATRLRICNSRPCGLRRKSRNVGLMDVAPQCSHAVKAHTRSNLCWVRSGTAGGRRSRTNEGMRRRAVFSQAGDLPLSSIYWRMRRPGAPALGIGRERPMSFETTMTSDVVGLTKVAPFLSLIHI